MTSLPTESPDQTGSSTAVRRFPEGLILVTAAILGAVIVLAALLVGRSLGGESTEIDTAGASSTTTTVAPPGTPRPTIGSDTQAPEEAAPQPEDEADSDGTPGPRVDVPEVAPVSCPNGVDPLICDAVDFVQQTRGRPFKTFPSVRLEADAEFDAALLEGFEESIEELEAGDTILSALGLLEADVSYVELFREVLEVGVVGRYEFESEQLVLRGEDLSLYVQNVLVHELTHALDDQWFDLDRDFEDDEAAYGFISLVEGNASRVDEQWTSELSADDQALLAQQEFAVLTPGDLRRLLAIPAVVLQLQISPYRDGAIYVDELVASGGEAAVDDALATPPRTSEEILHPGTDRSADPEVLVEMPPAGGDVIADGRLGEFLVGLWLGPVAGDGWGGDSFVAWNLDGRSCLTVDLAADSDGDLTDIGTAAGAWARQRPEDRSVTTSGVDQDLIRISGCQ